MDELVRAKFTCVSERKYKSWNREPGQLFLYEYEFQVVTGGSSDNDRFFASTPAGSIKLTAVASGLFEPGKDYYLDFTPGG